MIRWAGYLAQPSRTCSFGVATATTDFAQLFPSADAALYAAKRGGKDRTVLVAA